MLSSYCQPQSKQDRTKSIRTNRFYEFMKIKKTKGKRKEKKIKTRKSILHRSFIFFKRKKKLFCVLNCEPKYSKLKYIWYSIFLITFLKMVRTYNLPNGTSRCWQKIILIKKPEGIFFFANRRKKLLFFLSKILL